MENFPILFGNIDEDAEQHLFKILCACDVFNLSKENITCQLFAQTLHGNAHEWFYSLLPGIITSWDVLETLFTEQYFSRVHEHALVVGFHEYAHPPSPIKMYEERVLEEESNQTLKLFSKSNQRLKLFSKSNHLVESENEKF